MSATKTPVYGVTTRRLADGRLEFTTTDGPRVVSVVTMTMREACARIGLENFQRRAGLIPA